MTDDFKQYGKSNNGNFWIGDSIGVPHPYCISNKHLEFNDSMYLGKEQIIKMESEHDQVRCDICLKANRKFGNKILLFGEHEQALLVFCKADIKENKELGKYLTSIKDLATKNGYAGFAFADKREDKNEV